MFTKPPKLKSYTVNRKTVFLTQTYRFAVPHTHTRTPERNRCGCRIFNSMWRKKEIHWKRIVENKNPKEENVTNDKPVYRVSQRTSERTHKRSECARGIHYVAYHHRHSFWWVGFFSSVFEYFFYTCYCNVCVPGPHTWYLCTLNAIQRIRCSMPTCVSCTDTLNASRTNTIKRRCGQRVYTHLC